MRIEIPKDLDKLKELHAGDVVELTGVIYTSRDAAHLRMEQMSVERFPAEGGFFVRLFPGELEKHGFGRQFFIKRFIEPGGH